MGGSVFDWPGTSTAILAHVKIAATGRNLVETAKSDPAQIALDKLPALDFSYYDPWLDIAKKHGVTRVETYLEFLDGGWQPSFLDTLVGKDRVKADTPEAERVIVWVLEETKKIGDVETRVVEERETAGGQLAEVSRNYFAIDNATGDVYYFGEDVDEYKNGKVTGHGGAWLSGVNGAKFGLIVPGAPKAGDRYYQESAPKVAMDRAEVVAINEQITVPAGTFKNCLHTKETSALESGAEDKYYAPGVGIIKDAEFVLVTIEKGKS